MSWNQSAYTLLGAEMLAETLSGRKLTITQAFGGTEAVSESLLGNATDVQGEKIALGLLGIEDTEAEDSEGNVVPAKKVGIVITNEDRLKTCYLHQVAVFGHLDGESEDRMIYILQDERGIEVPPEAHNPDFEVDLYAVIFISNKAQITVNVTAGTRVTPSQVQQMIGEHNTDPAAHEETIRKAVQAAASGAVQIKDITIPAEGWTQSPGSDEAAALSYTIDLAVEGVTEAVYPSVAVHKAALEAANTAGLCPAVQALAGVLRFWAQTPPKTNLSATAILMTPGNMVGSSAGYVLPVATATRLGGVKIGPGITASPDGTITASNGGIPPEKVVSATDTEKMLDEIFPDNA